MFDSVDLFAAVLSFVLIAAMLIRVAQRNRGANWQRRAVLCVLAGVIFFKKVDEFPGFIPTIFLLWANAFMIVSMAIARAAEEGRGGRVVRVLESIRRSLANEEPA